MSCWWSTIRKFGRNAMVNMGSISMVDAVYTDTLPPDGRDEGDCRT